MASLFRKLKSDKAGLSLIELLIAVVILAIVAAPLLHAFVTSANMLSGSRKYGEATIAAQNVQEVVETSSVAAVVEGAASVQNLLGASVTKLSDSSCSITGLTSGARSYDALVTYDAGTPTNAAEIIQYSSMDAAFAQAFTEEENPDNLALANFTAMNAAASEVDGSRSIEIRLTRDSDNPELVYIKVVYDYVFNYKQPEYDSDGIPTGNIVAGAPYSYTTEYALFPHGTPYTDDANNPLSVYIMYFPYYGSSRETISIRNTDNITAKLFLVKQWALTFDGSDYDKLSSAQLTAKESTHITDINQYQSTTYTEGCSLYTNAGQNLTDGSSTTLSYRIFKGNLWYTSAANTLTGELASKEAVDRFYKVTIEIYPSSAGLTGSPVYTLETTKLK